MKVGNRHVALILVIIGIGLVSFSFYESYQAYLNYKPVLPQVTGDLAQAVTNASFELINLAARLAFIGVMVWAGSVILRSGIDLLKRGSKNE